MPTLDKILSVNSKIAPIPHMQQYVQEMYELTKRPIICYMSAFCHKGGSMNQQAILDADMQGFMTCSKGLPKNSDKAQLDLIIHSPGGDIEATKRIIFYIRKLYRHVRVFIPHLAMSGGTMIALAANEIWMGPYSSLGPTDPQVPIRDKFVPVGSIIKEFTCAKEDIKRDPAIASLWNERLKDIPIGMYQSILNAYEHAPRYVEDIIQKYMFSGSNTDKHLKIAKDVSLHLNAYDQHSNHNKGINLDTATALGLTVKDLSEDKLLEDAVLSIYHTGIIAFCATPLQKIIMNHLGISYAMT